MLPDLIILLPPLLYQYLRFNRLNACKYLLAASKLQAPQYKTLHFKTTASVYYAWGI